MRVRDLLAELAFEQRGPQRAADEEESVQGSLLGHRHLVDRASRIATRAVPLEHCFELALLGMGAAEVRERRRTAAHECVPINEIRVGRMLPL
jgi:hypothetical protein